ncbi:uncharacterized protein LTR77_001909 [Saxophila tyrrhenica]|uniref:Uncharacterized protein n=1 Tax=Saxophila tyrrhenica TaxID=1690608 RepID=A0AAV9PM02_9PEZI|nr:hypothetical protein LTR77_001909 [Saxophila tyrrhenica]
MDVPYRPTELISLTYGLSLAESMEVLLLLFLSAFLIASVFFVAVIPGRRAILLDRFQTSKQKASVSLTPPRLITPHEKQRPVRNTSQPQYADVFPPHRRLALADLPSDALKGSGATGLELSKLSPDYSKPVPDKAVSNSDELLDRTTPTGYSVAEIKRLGDFPDYASLSGIPLPTAYEAFNIDTAMPRPYRPYRWPYHQTMSLSKLDHDFWLELDKNYVSVIEQRQQLFQQYGDSVIRALPGSELACKELMEMVVQFLCARYPQHFRLDRVQLVFHNGILDTQTDLNATEPLHVLLQHVPEDFAIMVRDPLTGIYSFRAGIIMSSLGWNLGSKIGLKLSEIHSPVPEYKEKMQFSMDRYFAKKPTDRAIQRGSWGLEVDQPLYMPPGDPQEAHREEQNPELTVDRVHLRVDWQTLRRLPLSGAVVFNFKGLFTPVTEFRNEPYIPSLILKVLKEGKRSIMEYKSTWHTEHVVIPALEQYEREQIDNGLIEKDWEPQTLDESPFFPGWEEKWHRQQGF